ncbi:uncharacterized protein [Prorops nasuta]|uniref:uncharacterized protein n=1 Tax=Prorops nasuta TaxID=863751 RepID=UPI0034CFF7D4
MRSAHLFITQQLTLRLKGRFVKEKVLDKQKKFVLQMQEGRKRKEENLLANNNVADSNLLDGRRIVDLKELANNLVCCKCKHVLSLKNVKKENRLGLNSVFWINCDDCNILTKVETGKMHRTASNSKHANVNTKAILGCLHSGIGCTALNKVLACLNIPVISKDLFKRYEREVGPAIEAVAKESCQLACDEERQLVIKEIDKLSKELPSEIFNEIYPYYQSLHSAIDYGDHLSDNSSDNTSKFDSAVGEIINIIVSYDMAWSKRHKKEDHDCRQNFQGSAKAMEPAVGNLLSNQSNILQNSCLNVRVLIGDEDSSTISAVRKGANKKIFKLSDRNHLHKLFNSDLYKLRTQFSEMRKKNVVPHIKKCLCYAITQNKGNSLELANAMRSIPDHLFNNHENCGSWCLQGKDRTSQQTVLLKQEELYNTLKEVFYRYANNAHKFSITASSQANESINNIMAHKAPKNCCYSRSESADFRYASSICTKNEGDKHLLQVEKKLQLSPGKQTARFASRQDKSRLNKSIRSKLLPIKRRRIIIGEKRDNLKNKNEKSEGIQYQTNCGFFNDANKSDNILDFSGLNIYLSTTTDKISSETCSIVYFDLETSGFHKNDEILQIAAQYEQYKFSVYITPTQSISSEASRYTGLSNVNGHLYLHLRKLLTIPLIDALYSFLQFLSIPDKPCVLVAHNGFFDSSHLIRAILNCNMIQDCKVIAGFSDTLILFKRHFPERKGAGKFKLQILANDLLIEPSNGTFHEALYDVEVLKSLSSTYLNSDDILNNAKSFSESVNNILEIDKICITLLLLQPFKHVVKDGILRKMAKENITYEIMKKKYEEEGETGVIKILTELKNGKPKVFI